jgi:predicted nucleotide-binding protein
MSLAFDADSNLPKDRSVFVVHGRDQTARQALFTLLRSLDLRPIEWSQAIAMTGGGSPYIGEVLRTAFSRAQAIVVLLTPDDEARLRPQFVTENEDEVEKRLAGQARPNVLFEAGMAVGFDEQRTILVEVGRLKPFSDIAGRHAVRFDGSSRARQDLVIRLRTAGCRVNLDGTDWLTAGDFGTSEDASIEVLQADTDRTGSPANDGDSDSTQLVTMLIDGGTNGRFRVQFRNTSLSAVLVKDVVVADGIPLMVLWPEPSRKHLLIPAGSEDSVDLVSTTSEVVQEVSSADVSYYVDSGEEEVRASL